MNNSEIVTEIKSLSLFFSLSLTHYSCRYVERICIYTFMHICIYMKRQKERRENEGENVFQYSVTAIPEKINLKRRKFYFGSQFCRFQSVASRLVALDQQQGSTS